VPSHLSSRSSSMFISSPAFKRPLSLSCHPLPLNFTYRTEDDETTPVNTCLCQVHEEYYLDFRVKTDFPEPPPCHQSADTGPDEVSAGTHGLGAFNIQGESSLKGALKRVAIRDTRGLRIPSFSSGLATLSRLFIVLCLLGASAQALGTRGTRATGREGMDANASLRSSAIAPSRTVLPTCSSQYTSTYLQDNEEEGLSDMERILYNDELSLGQGKMPTDRQSCLTVKASTAPSTTSVSPKPLSINKERGYELLKSESTHERDRRCEGGSEGKR
jgi:hypothetical protein